MPLIDGSPQRPAPRDDLDDLFNYDASMDDAFRDTNNKSDIPTADQAQTRRKNAYGGADLGIDEEIKITKKRQPIAKLDEARVLSNAGIPKLRKITKERLKFRGKGHEFSDVSRLLNLYQLWLDDLYPRAKFADGLAIIEKLGHKKLMQIKRKEWIDEGKPRSHFDEMPDYTEEAERDTLNPAQGRDTDIPNANEEGVLQNHEDAPVHPREADDALGRSADSGGDQGEDDDLEALLAEDAARAAMHEGNAKHGTALHGDFEDEMEAMADLGVW